LSFHLSLSRGLAAAAACVAVSATATDGYYVSGAYRTYAEAAVAWRAHDSACKSLDASLPGLFNQFNDAQGVAIANTATLSNRIRELRAENDRLLEEFRRGLRCSKCKKTQTELGGPAAFQQHLGQVQGTPLPPTAEEIAEKQRELEDRVRPFQQQLRDILDRVQRTEAALNKARADRQRECEAAGIARAAAQQLYELERRKLQTPDAGNSEQSAGPYACEKFPAEARRRLQEAEAALQQATRELGDENGEVGKSRAELTRLKSELGRETDLNKREIWQRAIDAENLKQAMHEQQEKTMTDKLERLRKDIEALRYCLAKAGQ
jgi:hypothetical protein